MPAASTSTPFHETASLPFDAQPRQRTVVHDLFSAQASITPDAPALWHDGETLTYRELDEWSNAIAHRLATQGVGTEVPVAICMPRGMAQIASLLGVLKAGGAYVPVDLTFPDLRIAAILESARAGAILTDGENSARFLAADAAVISVAPTARAPRPPKVRVSPLHLAYVIYTSGSTGRPKGVAMPHEPLLNLIGWQNHASLDLPPRARTLQFSSISFDVSFQEILSTLSTGGTLVLVSDEIRRDGDELWRFLCVAEINRIFLPFVALQQLADAAARSHRTADSLREIITAGEQLRITPQLRAMMRRLPGCRLENQYGPTETHVVTAYTMPADTNDWPTLPPIGHEIPGAEIFLLGPEMTRVRDGEPGELYIAGECLARGYLHRADLTASRFIASPLPDALGRRLYRTGDLGRRLPDGEIEFLGRADDQVKLRGFRIELGEIENVLCEHPCIAEAAAGIRNERITAWFVMRPGTVALPAELRAFLKKRLAEYMVPAAFVPLPALPLTPSGKLDRRSLPAPEEAAASGTPPRTQLEARLAEIWSRILHAGNIGIQAGFFDLGGHSLLVGQMIAAVEREFGQTIGCAAFYENPTIEFLAECLTANFHSGAATAREPVLTLNERGTRMPLVFFHGDFVKGDGWARELARTLGPDQPIHIVQPHGMDGDTPPPTIAEMARSRIAAIRARITGPCVLAGYSNGGLAAFEAASMLGDVRGVVLIGSEARVLTRPCLHRLSATASFFLRDGEARRQQRHLRLLAQRNCAAAAWKKFLALPLQAKLATLLRKGRRCIAGAVPTAFTEDPLTRLRRIYGEAYEGWQPRRFDGKVWLLWPDEDHPATPGNPVAEWSRICREARWRPVPGDHHSVVAHDCHLRQLAAALRCALDDLGANRAAPVITAQAA